MILAHLSDLHLGHRAFERTERGRNVREADVALAFQRAVEEVGRLAPAIVLIAGDVFDRPEPPSTALVAFTRGLETLHAALPDARVLVVAGARDTPRHPGTPGVLAALDAFPQVVVATGTARSVYLPELALSVLLLPHRALLAGPYPTLRPDPRARWNVLVAHGRPGSEGPPVEVSEWDYVALGHEHTHRRVSEHVVYPGSLERVGTEPWSEGADEKGFVTFDLEAGRMAFHPVQGRAVVALAPIRVASEEPHALEARVREVTDEVPGGIDDKIVRLTLAGLRHAGLVGLQGEWLAGLRARAIHLLVEGAPPAGVRRPPGPGPLERVRRAVERLGGDPTVVRDEPEEPPGGDGSGRVGRPRVRLRAVPPFRDLVWEPGPGLQALVGEDGGARRRLADLMGRAVTNGGALQVDGGEVRVEGNAGGEGPPPREEWVRLWEGSGMETPEAALALSAALLARLLGGARLEAMRSRLAPPRPDEPDEAEQLERARSLEHAPEELRARERELRDLRADHAEVAGDLDAAVMEWLRERQDAETRLQAYRDRARELKARISQMTGSGPGARCPTCGRPLESHLEDVVTYLREEWETVVQDGSWWKRRREQLEDKPSHVRKLEGRALRLQAATEACTERLERARSSVEELGGVRRRLASPVAAGPGEEVGDAASDAPGADVLPRALDAATEELAAEARVAVLERAAGHLVRLSGGRMLGLRHGEGGRLRLEGVAGPLEPAADEDLAAAALAVRLAGVEAARELAGPGTRSLLVREPFDRLEGDVRIRAVELLRRTAEHVGQVLLFTRGDAVDAVPEAFDGVHELRGGGAGGERLDLRRVSAGAGRIRLLGRGAGG